MKGVPEGAVVETNAYFSKDSVRPMVAGELPAPVNALVLRHIYNQETLVKAGIARDKEMAYRAFVNDPLVSLSLKDSRDLFNHMLENTREYLPGWEL